MGRSATAVRAASMLSVGSLFRRCLWVVSRFRGVWLLAVVLAWGGLAAPAAAQNQLGIFPSTLDAPGGNVESGANFRYRVSYSCDLISIPTCDGATVTVDLPPEVQFVSSFFPPSDVVSGVHDGSPAGGTVTFTFQPSVPAGNTGDLDVTVRFPNGSTADGTPSTGNVNAVVSTGTGLVTQMEDLPPVTAEASPQVNVSTGLGGGFIDDCPTGSTYDITVGPSSANGSLDLLDADVVLQLPVGVTNVVPQDGGIYDVMTNTVTWTGLGPIAVPNSVTVSVDVSFLDPPFSAGQTVTSTVTTTVDPLGEPPGLVIGPTDFMHTLQQFVEIADSSVSKTFGDGRPSSLPPAEGQDFSYSIGISNSGNLPLDTLVVTDDGDGAGADLDAALTIRTISTGAYSPAPTSVTINVTGDMGSTPSITSANGSSNAILDLTGLLAPGERVITIEWVFNGGAPVGMSPSTRAEVEATTDVGFPAGTNVDNHVTSDWTATFTGICGPPVGPTSGSDTASFDFDVNGPYTYLRPNKGETTSGPYFPGDTVGFSISVTNDSLADDPASDIVVTDLLPNFLTFQGGSETYADNFTGVSLDLFEAIDNYNGTGRTLLRWNLLGDLDPGETIDITFDTTLELGVIFGNLSNTAGVSFAPSAIQQICAGASSTDAADLDGDSDTADTLCTDTEGITVAAVAQLASTKLVRGQCNSSGPGFIPGLGTDDSLPGAIVDWRVEVQNIQTVPMEDFVIIDILPFVGDTGVRTSTPRDSLFRPLLVAPITPPPGGAVFYSLSGNPCRPEVNGPTTGCDNPNWTTIPPTPITDAQSIKVEFGDLVLNPLDKLEFQWRMIAPADGPTDGSESFNSFAFGSSRQDDGGFLGAEPNKVGIDLTCVPVAPDDAMLGDFVWVDANGDGQQTGGEVGVNDVPVDLFDPGPDGLPRTGDDILLLSTITADDAMGNPGWYKFSALSPGDYYVQFTPPPNFEVTVQDAGGDEALDSDADVITACTDVVTLGPSEVNLDVDLGLLPPVTASLGNYVWFDRDGNGQQNEASTDGVNGVAVKLFVDDGDGIADPDGNDGSPVQVTVTANDVNGNPGFYLFEDLIPGVRYFVQFMLPSPATGFTTRNSGNDTTDSDARTDGTTSVVILSAGEFNSTVDAGLVLLSGDLSLGNLVWCDDDGNGIIDAAGDDDGVFDPLVPEAGINGVRVNLYADINLDGLPQVNEFYTSTQTVTLAGKDGRYRFDGLPAGDFIVEVDASNFVPGGPFDACSITGVVTSTGNEPTPDPDNDLDSDDSGDLVGTSVVSQAVTLSVDGEPTPDADDDLEDDNNINFTVDFGFIPGAVLSFDYGDAPDAGGGTGQGNYQTVVFDGGAQHLLPGPMGPYLGTCVDSDTGSAQSFAANADDVAGGLTVTHGACTGPGDDEDGVGFSTTTLMLGGSVDITLSSSSAVGCLVNGWIDWNRNGDFGDAGEQVFTDAAVASGSIMSTVPVPATATPGFTYARFRCSVAGGDGPIGPSPDGEVEDYRLQVAGVDFGDAPDSYGTTTGMGGPSHGTNPNVELYLGTCVDTEPDGQPINTADGDDTNLGDSQVGDCIDDEDGITFNGMLVRGMTASVTATASIPSTGFIDGWIDFDGSGTFDHPAEHLFGGVSQALVTGSNSLPSFVVPANAAVGFNYARFRLTSGGGALPTGPAADGEVEDYRVIVKGFDFGDAPDPEYPTLLASVGAQHVVDPTGTLYLGPGAFGCADVENDGVPSMGADGDDTTPSLNTSADAGICDTADDEDGVTFDTMLFTCQQAQITVTTGRAGRLDAWIDYDRSNANGFGGLADQIFTNRALSSGTNVLTFNVPCGAQLGDSYARFRFSTAGNLAPTGLAMDGEVEDYPVLIKGVDFGDAADTYDTSFGAGGPTHGVTPGTNFYLGACVDTEPDAGTPLNTTGDDVSAGTSTEGTCAVSNDDEDGVAFTSMLIGCLSADVDVTASAAGVLDAWVDFDGNGTFDAADRIFNGQALAAGVNSLSFSVPCDVAPGNTSTRFRFSSTGVSGPATPAMDGEVEDDTVFLKASDFGDAPDSYDTSESAGGPSHGVDPNAPDFFLGVCVDTEGDAETPLDGSGDDSNASGDVDGTCVGNDDEDGVSFDTMIIACQTTDLTVTASAAGLLDAWLDFDGDGTFGGGEQTFSSQALAAGGNSLSFAVPCDANVGDTYARFRFSSTGGLSPGGATMDGEVEDYSVLLKGSDYGDAPDTYGTTIAGSGPIHGVDPSSTLYLGTCVDTEDDAQAPLDASGDDVNASGDVVGTCTGGDDEDGVSFDTMLIACQDADMTFTVGAAGLLDAWLDFDGDGTFAQAGEQIFTSEALTLGANSRTISVPCDAAAGDTYARFRLSSTGGLGIGGPSMDGEVEDYAVLVKGSDWGDAPDTYGTSSSAGGPLHGVDPNNLLALGACVDTEADAQAPLDSTGDDVNASADVVGTCVGGDDEDGVTFDTMVLACQQADLTVTATAAGVLDAWIDFGADGTFAEAGDRIFSGQALAAGANSLSFNVPCSAAIGTTYVRFRFSSTGIGTSGGPSMDGEVEDYSVTVKGADFGDLPDTFQTTDAANGAVHGVDPSAPLHLGACVDTETDAGLPLDASGDDVTAGTSTVGTCAVANDDEDGVTFDTDIVACRDVDITVTAVTAGILDAWIDFDGSGDFTGPADQIFAGEALAAGAQTLTFNVPCDAVPGTTYVRYRFSSTGVSDPFGPSMDGEVEDYVVTLDGVDFGDAPDSYDTLFSSNGPSHAVDTAGNPFLGSCVDTEVDGQVISGDATDDDSNVGNSVAGVCSGDDDEDGVTFDTLVTACKPATITVTASAPGLLDAWIDYDADGAFVELEDRIYTAEPLVAGPNSLTFDVPCTATSGTTFARFRFSTAGVASHDGPAPDGEVEDYQISSDEVDFGDAPDTYSTVFGSSGALHGLDPALDLYLGACVDSEVDGQPSVGADGDDANIGTTVFGTCLGDDDEDGVVFETMIVACQQVDLTVTASDAGRLDAWLDLDGDGTFNGPADQIFTDQALAAGSNSLSFQVPCDATPGDSYARFRFGSIGNLGFFGTTPNGEVEDYAVVVKGSDLGDAPDTYQTTFGAGGPTHGVDTAGTLFLGTCVDTENDGQPNVAANGDDLGGGTSVAGTCTGGDDEDGVTFVTEPTVCLDTELSVVAASAGILDAWLDLDGDGTFVGPADQIFASQALVPGVNTLMFNVPCDAIPGDSYARFRFSSTGGLPIGGPSMDGEVEDYAVLVQGFDFGDAPDPDYPTLMASDGARHVVLPTGNPTLGNEVDIEIEGLQSPDHMGDDNDGTDDEDGISFTGLYIPNAPATVFVETGDVGGFLNAWIDYNQNGDWTDPGEQIATDLAVAANTIEDLELTVDLNALVGETCARFRISTFTGLEPTGQANDGEVEDYTLEVTEENPLLGLSKVILDVQRIDPGASYNVTFFMRAENFGNIRIGEVQILSDLADAFADAESMTVLSVESTDLSINPDFDGDTDVNVLTGSDALDPEESGEVLMVVNVVPAGEPGPYFCSSVITGVSDADTDVMDVSHNGDDPDGNDNGDPSDDDTPTDVIFDLPPTEIPTLGTWGMLLMGLLLAAFGGRRLRQR